MARGFIRAPGVNLLVPSDPSRRIRTLGPGDPVEILDGTRWLRVAVGGVSGLVPAAAVEVEAVEVLQGPFAVGAGARTSADVQPLAGTRSFVGDAPVAHVDFHPALRRLDDFATRIGVKLHVTRGFQPLEPGEDASRLPAARRSNHLVGHAVDLEIIVAERRLGGEQLRTARLRELPAEVRYLVQQIRDDVELRWGGDFVRPDPGHVDDDLHRRDPETWWRKLRAL